MKSVLLPLVAMVAVSSASVCGETPLRETRSTLEKWVEARQLVSKAKSDWQSDKESLEQTIQLFERELKAVDEQMLKVNTNSVQVDKERSEAESLKSASTAALERVKAFAAEFEKKVKTATAQMPVPLQDTLKPLLNHMPAEGNTKMSAAERLQVIIGILNEMDKFDNAVSVFSEKRKDPKGEEIAVETLYVGLGTAYFVNDKGDFAGVGSPGKAGWEWTNKPEIAPSVREAIRVYRNERPAAFVSLPATIH
jgi:Protein of unknown function (DUF3450)